jgi:transcriptional regulator with XRE-family HTH domain
MPEPREYFGQNLRKHRNRLGLSQERLAFDCDLDPSEIGRLERGTRDPRLATICRVADGLGIAPTELLLGIPQRRRDETD